MIFNAEHLHLEIDHELQWLTARRTPIVGLDDVFEFYWEVETAYQVLAEEEFAALERARSDGSTVEEAFLDPSVANPLTSWLAQKLIVLHGIAINQLDDGYETAK